MSSDSSLFMSVIACGCRADSRHQACQCPGCSCCHCTAAEPFSYPALPTHSSESTRCLTLSIHVQPLPMYGAMPDPEPATQYAPGTEPHPGFAPDYYPEGPAEHAMQPRMPQPVRPSVSSSARTAAALCMRCSVCCLVPCERLASAFILLDSQAYVSWASLPWLPSATSGMINQP